MRAEDRRQKTEDRRQKTEDRRQKTVVGMTDGWGVLFTLGYVEPI